jgi:ABC-type Na+ efflux pump permease subunit
LRLVADQDVDPLQALRQVIVQLVGWAIVNRAFLARLVLDASAGERGARRFLHDLDADAETFGSEAAAARRDSAEAQLRSLRKGRRPVEIQAIDQQLAQAKAALSASTSALQRNQKLVQDGFQSSARIDELRAARDGDAARLKELQAQRRLALEAARSDDIAAAAAAKGSVADLAPEHWREAQKERSAPVDALVYDVMYRPGVQPSEMRIHKRCNPEDITAHNVVPGLMGVILTMTLVMMTAMAMTRERERGTLENLLATPVRPLEMMIGKILPYALIGCVQVLIVFLRPHGCCSACPWPAASRCCRRSCCCSSSPR